MIEINGAHGEGGGQVLRTSLTLAALTKTPLNIHHIRENRSQPGLRPQHLAAVKAIAKLTNAEVSGARLNSRELRLVPASLRPGRHRFDIPTAGALTLVFQTIFLPLSFAGSTSEITLTGGTHVPWSPIFHYVTHQWLPVMLALGFRGELTLHKAGFYPQGGGEVRAKILPAQGLQPFSCLARGDLSQLRGLSGVANLEDEIAKRQKHQALKRLYPFCKDSKLQTRRFPSVGKGTFILLKADFSNGGIACYSALGAPGKPAEIVANEAVDQLLTFLKSDGCVDQYLADQLLLPLLMIDGDSAFRISTITPHLLTNAHVIGQFLPGKINIEGAVNSPGVVHISGDRLDY